MDHPESTSIIMMLALSALLGVITLICWCRELWQKRAAMRWATQPLVDSADKGDGPESVQHGLRDADTDLEAATDQAISLSLRQCELAVQDLTAIGSTEEKPGQNARSPLVDSANKGDGPESLQHGLRDADMGLAAFRLSSGGWRMFPSTDELKTLLTGDALRQSNARLMALVLAILVGVIGTLVILAAWLSLTPEQIQAARNGQGKQGTQQSTPAGDAQPSLLGQYGQYEQSASTPAPEQSTSTPAPEQPRGWIAQVKKSRPICKSVDDYVQIQRMAPRLSRKAMRRVVEFSKRKCPIKMFEPGNHASVERTETFSIDKTRSITLACVVIKDGPCAWTDASELARIPVEDEPKE